MSNRVDSQALKTAADLAEKKLDEASAALGAYLTLLTVDERRSTLKPPDDFLTKGPELARAARQHPGIAETSGYDPDAVLEDLNNVALLAPVAEKVEHLRQLLADARLAWLAEAFAPSLVVYGVAKEIAKINPEVQKLVSPLSSVFATPRQKQVKQDEAA